MNSELQTLIDLQAYDSRIATLEAEAARLPKQIEAIQASLAEAKKTVDAFKAKIDQTRKDLRAKEKDLEVHAAKRAKEEARLYEVKTNKEYSAVLLEIEEIKQIKAKTEEEILGLMEMQERLGRRREGGGERGSRPAKTRRAGRRRRARQARPRSSRSWASCAASAARARKELPAGLARELRAHHEGARRHRGGVGERGRDLRRLPHEHPTAGAAWSCASRPGS